ncbi:MAG: hypothetical protein FWD80_03810, partial [Propionibacteriaceae bacterium]|nr:hypothetical protein [Propionibacteriaceae bacterium]
GGSFGQGDAGVAALYGDAIFRAPLFDVLDEFGSVLLQLTDANVNNHTSNVADVRQVVCRT